MYDLERHRSALWAAPCASAYGLGLSARAALYAMGLLRVHHAPVPVLSVGGLEAGGTGKTPVVGHIIRRLMAAGRRPGLLTRGYGRVPRALAVRAVGEQADPALLGDEAAMLVGGGLNIPVAACGARVQGAYALAALGCDCVVMDDGFAHRGLHRDVDIVVLRGEQVVQRARLLPHGSLREQPHGLARAHCIWLHHREGPSPAFVPQERVTHWQGLGFTGVWVRSDQGPLTVADGAGGVRSLQHTAVVAAAGIARPDEFARQLVAAGAQLKAFFPFPDHHRFDQADQARLARAVAQSGAQALVVTAKDAVKIGPNYPGVVWVAQAPLVLHDAADVLGQLLVKTGFLPAS